LGKQFEDVVPGLSLEVLGVSFEVFTNLDEGLGFEGLLEERSTESVFNDFLSSFNNVGSSVVFLLFSSPVSIVFSFIFIEFDDSVTGFGEEFVLFSEEFDLFISNGDLFVEFSLEFSSSVVSSGDFGSQSADFAIALTSDSLDVFVIFVLFTLDEVVDFLEGFD